MPDETWTALTSPGLPYSLRLPPGWTFSGNPFGSTIDSYGDETNSFSVEMAPGAAGIDPGQWLAMAELNIADIGKVERTEPTTVGGRDARIFTIRKKRLFRDDFHALRASFHDGVYGWDLTLVSGPEGGSVPDPDLFAAVIATFERLPVVQAADDPSGNVWALHPGDCFHSLPLPVTTGPEAVGTVSVFVGGVDGFRRVSADEPHVGEIAAVLGTDESLWPDIDAAFASYVGTPRGESELGILFMAPLREDETVPPDVGAVLAIAHPHGVWTGQARGSGR